MSAHGYWSPHMLLWDMLFTIQVRKLSSERVAELLKVTQLVGGRVRV